MDPIFATKLQFQDDGGLPFTLLQGLVYGLTFALGGPAVMIEVPAGFKTDLASIPRGLWNVLPQTGKYDAAAVIHDFLYQKAPAWGHGGPTTTRAGADRVLYEAMGVCGVPAWQRWVIYAGVRVGGGRIWDSYRAADRARGRVI